jgi:DNA-binding MarR family transcriptional regulator
LAHNVAPDHPAPDARTAAQEAGPRRSRRNNRAARPAADDRLDESTLRHILGYRLAQASIVVRQVYHEHIGEPMNLRTVEFSLLMLLAANRDVTPTQLARTLSLSAPNLTQLLDRLAERGLLAREPSPHDRRAQHIRLTRTGQALARRAHEASLGMEAEALAHFSDAERAMLFELLERVVRRRAP